MAVPCFSGDRNTSWATRKAWNSPSAVWLTRRPARRRRKSREARAAFALVRLLAPAISPAIAPAPGSARRLGVEEVRPVRRLRCAVAQDELLDHLPGGVVGELHGRGLHEVRAGPDERTAHPTVEGEARAPDGVDHDPGRVRRVPHLELHVDGERHVAEGGP